jgi:hypothetical protein
MEDDLRNVAVVRNPGCSVMATVVRMIDRFRCPGKSVSPMWIPTLYPFRACNGDGFDKK